MRGLSVFLLSKGPLCKTVFSSIKRTLGCDEVWENECTPNILIGVGVRLHSMGLSVREVVTVLDLLGVERSHSAIWN